MANDEVIWATSTTGEDFQCVHVDAWRTAQARIKELERACDIALQFWYSDHPNDTSDAMSAYRFVRDVMAKRK